MNVLFIGGGNMGRALVGGLLAQGRTPGTIAVVEVDAAASIRLQTEFGIRAEPAIGGENVARAGIIVLAIKPQQLRQAALALAPHLVAHLVISIAAGVPIAALERRLTGPARIVRAMPNTPALVGKSATALSAGEHATEADLALATQIFDAVGITTVVDEPLLDAVTGLSGSGPAYVFLVIEALCDAGVKVGLSRHVALKLATQTVLGSAQLLLETGAHPGALKDQVTSPGGTAIAGLHTLEAGGLRTTLIDAVETASRRAKELGDAFLAKATTPGK